MRFLIVLLLLSALHRADAEEDPGPAPMAGPFRDLAQFCQQPQGEDNRRGTCLLALTDPPGLDTTPAAPNAKERSTPQRHVEGLTYLKTAALPAPFLQAQVFTRVSEHPQVCQHSLALRTSAGWFVRPLSAGGPDGCGAEGYWENGDPGEFLNGHAQALELAVRELLPGSKQIVVRYRWLVQEFKMTYGPHRVGSPPEQELIPVRQMDTTTEATLLCGAGPSQRPSCLEFITALTVAQASCHHGKCPAVKPRSSYELQVVPAEGGVEIKSIGGKDLPPQARARLGRRAVAFR